MLRVTITGFLVPAIVRLTLVTLSETKGLDLRLNLSGLTISQT